MCKLVETYDAADLNFLFKGINMNKKLCEEGLKNNYPYSMSLTIQKIFGEEYDPTIKIHGDDFPEIFGVILGYVLSSVDARMYGCSLPVMSLNNSGGMV